MDLVDILADVRYWSEVLCCTILIHISDLEVKVTDFEILCLSFWLKFLELLRTRPGQGNVLLHGGCKMTLVHDVKT